MRRSYQALYYPFIHFRDEGWIKAMALYWEGVSRIVPRGYRTHDGDDVKALIDDGVVSNVVPEDLAVEPAAAAMSAILNERTAELIERYGLHGIESWVIDEPAVLWANRFADSRLAYLHEEKLNHILIQQLVDAGLARRGRRDDRRWIGMHPRLVDAYMVALADAVAVREAAYPLTDDYGAHRAVAHGLGVDPERLAQALFGMQPAERGARDAEEMLVAVAFDAELPDLRRVPIERIIDLRRRTEESRLRFQEGIAALVGTEVLKEAKPAAVGREMERLYRSRIAPSVAIFGEEARKLSVETTMSVLSVKTSLPLAGLLPMVGVAQIADGPLVWATAAVSAAVGIVQARVAASRARNTLRASEPVGAYLADLKGLLPAKELAALTVT